MTTLINLEGTNNTRDLGGIINLDNKIIKKNLLFRSDKLSNLTENDINTIKELGIQTIIDFRSITEKKKEPNIIPDSIEYIEMPIDADKSINDELMPILEGKSNKKMTDFLIDANKDFVLKYSKIFSEFIINLIKNQKPTLFHCTAGKDRTGFATYIILSLLDVSEETIIDDYLKTNEFTKNKIDDLIVHVSNIMNISKDKSKLLKPLLTVDIEYINSAINTINEYYHNKNNYIKNILKINDTMKQQFKNYMLVHKL